MPLSYFHALSANHVVLNVLFLIFLEINLEMVPAWDLGSQVMEMSLDLGFDLELIE